MEFDPSSSRRAVQVADATLAGVLGKAQFWQRWAGTPTINQRQTQVLNRVLDGLEGKLTNAKCASINKCSTDTALRDINDLLARGVLRPPPSSLRNTPRASRSLMSRRAVSAEHLLMLAHLALVGLPSMPSSTRFSTWVGR